jgi:glycosyltransferase involved in cell wall biosynthesis
LEDVIVVDDGSEDGTSELVKHHYGDRVKVIRFERNQGKGAAVKSGMLAARGDFVIVMDADNSFPIQNLNFALPYLEDYDIIIPSRKFLPEYNVGLVRKVGNKVFSWYVNRMLGLGVQDPQCGFKVFRRKAVLPCVEQMVQKRWVYDSELLYLAKKRGLRIKDVPIQFWPSSRPSRFTGSEKCSGDVLANFSHPFDSWKETKPLAAFLFPCFTRGTFTILWARFALSTSLPCRFAGRLGKKLFHIWIPCEMGFQLLAFFRF